MSVRTRGLLPEPRLPLRWRTGSYPPDLAKTCFRNEGFLVGRVLPFCIPWERHTKSIPALQGEELLGIDGAELVNGLTDDVNDPAQRLLTHRHLRFCPNSKKP